MAKKKIGTSNVVNGEARDWFNLDQSLERGVYQLIAEYSGSSTYKPSYDTKKLIVGLYSELQDLDANYKILDKNVRRITITGTLYGYNELNNRIPLANKKIGCKLGSVEYENRSGFEQLLDATTLVDYETDEKTVRTNALGEFTFHVEIPTTFNNERYKLMFNFGGDDNYVATVHVADLYLGLPQTVIKIDTTPSKHIRNDGILILGARVFLKKDVIDGVTRDGAERVKNGSITFYMSKSPNGIWHKIQPNESFEYWYTDTLGDDGLAEMRVFFKCGENEQMIRYFKAVYTGSPNGLGYADSSSPVIQVQIDKNGVTATSIYAKLQGFIANPDKKILYVKKGVAEHVKTFTLAYRSDNSPVEDGTVRFVVDNDLNEKI